MDEVNLLRVSMYFLTSDAVFTLSLHLQRLNIDTLVANEASTGNATVWLTETFFRQSKKENKLCFRYNCLTALCFMVINNRVLEFVTPSCYTDMMCSIYSYLSTYTKHVYTKQIHYSKLVRDITIFEKCNSDLQLKLDLQRWRVLPISLVGRIKTVKLNVLSWI